MHKYTHNIPSKNQDYLKSELINSLDSIDSLNINLSSFIKEKNLQIDNETKNY